MSTHPHNVYQKPEEIPFRHMEPIGHGGQGSVDAVEREGKLYARKTFVLSRTPKPMEFEGVLREVKITDSLVHKHIVRLIETYQRKNTYAIIMEPVAEGNLGTYLSDLDDIPKGEDNGRRERLARWFQCLTNAVAYLHSSSVHHRDIKPQNILTLRGDVLLTDFGISEKFQETTMSGSTEVIGTRTYRSPERENKRRSGRREDIFSLGAVFLEMLTVYSRTGELGKLSQVRGGPYSHNLDNIHHWICLLLENQWVPSWYPAMLSLCGLMLEKERKNRPYAGDLLALWKCSTSIAGYQAPCLPLAQCNCASLLLGSECESWMSWSQVLLNVSVKGEWTPDPLIITKWDAVTARWYELLPFRWNINSATLAGREAILEKQRNAQDLILFLYERSKNPDFRQRPKYMEVKTAMEALSALNSKPLSTIDLEKEQKRHEDWMRHGKKLFGIANAPLHILLTHMEQVDERNRSCFDLSDQPRMPVEPLSRANSLEEDEDVDSPGSIRDIFCICRKPEAGMMIECELCHEW
jgi:serine/threonine protein kinase